jgi:hypothetical protein
MGLVAKRVKDQQVLKLLRAFLHAGVMENGLLSPATKGTPQGGPLTPRTQKITWLRRHLRMVFWRQWKRGRLRFAALRRLRVGRDLAAKTAGSAHGPWRLSRSPALSFALPNTYFISLGLPTLAPGR